MKKLENFMWEYQDSFQRAAQEFAEGIFKKLDKNLSPNVFLVGVIVEEEENHSSVCIVPKDCNYQPNIFSEIIKDVEELVANDRTTFIFGNQEVINQNKNNIYNKALQNAITNIINSQDTNNFLSFCSYPVLIEKFKIVVIIQCNKKAFNSHYSLSKYNRIGGIDRGYKSLLDSTINKFFYECVQILRQPNPASDLFIFKAKVNEIIKRAGESFMYTPAYAANKSYENLYILFDSCNIISSLPYEGAEGIGRILIAEQNHHDIEMVVTLESPIQIDEYRAIRKLLEMSSGNISLVSDSNFFYGLGILSDTYNVQNENLFIVTFIKHGTWELSHGDNPMMRVVYEKPELPQTLIDKPKFCVDLKRIFHNITQNEIESLLSLVKESTKQKHGTMVVVSDGAKEEAERLKNQSTKISPIRLTPSIIKAVSAIDGAILISPGSICHAIGVILDGMATNKGNPARGARYNSAIRYIETSEDKCVGIVVSEDGSVDLIPDLMPQISRSLMTERIELLQEMKNTKVFDNLKFNQAMSWLEENRFYLLPEMCREINKLKSELQRLRDNNSESYAIIFTYDDFEPNEDMNESYFIG